MNGIIEPKNHLAWSKIAVAACLIGCLGDFFAVTLFSHFYAAFDPRAQPSSALGAAGSPIAGIVSAWWILMGLILILFAFAYFKSEVIPGAPHRLAAWLIGLYAVGEEIGSGVFPGNHVAGHLTTIGWVHNGIGGIGVAALIISPIVLMKKYKRTEQFLMNRFLLFISVLGFVSFIVFALSHFHIHGMQWLYSLHGVWQRVFQGIYYTFLIVIAIKQYFEKQFPQPHELFNLPQQP